MEISAKGKKLSATLQDKSVCERHYGTAMCKKLNIRIAALQAAESLAAFWPPKSGPERCHELKGDGVGTFSIDLAQPYRLLFRPVEELPPEDRANEKERWNNITEVILIAIEDTHG